MIYHSGLRAEICGLVWLLKTTRPQKHVFVVNTTVAVNHGMLSKFSLFELYLKSYVITVTGTFFGLNIHCYTKCCWRGHEITYKTPASHFLCE